MKLTVVIVNYNVRHFLDQCLKSVEKAITNVDAEVYVVDNISSDDSVEMVKKTYPWVKLIANQENVGFSRANNQAMKVAKGEYVLLLNPDTVVEEDAFEKCIEFMDSNPEAGGLGVKMVDGTGTFLPESKRGLPTPAVSFYKIFGLSSIFPKSKKFAKYHLRYLKEDDINEIEILSGAYMWMRKSALDKVGLLDETFFMYGEDIDLSYRIIKGGYKNYYFPDTKIIHYKGESTKKGSLNYVFVFYNAMIIFSKKHFAHNAKVFSFFITIAIYLRAFLSVLKRLFNFIKMPIIDAALISMVLLTFNFLKPFIGFPNRITITNNYGLLNVAAVLLSYILSLAICKGYLKTVHLNKTIKGLALGSILFYGINFAFPTEYSFSNKFIISILTSVSLIIYLNRIILHYYNKRKVKANNKKNYAIVGSKNFIANQSGAFVKHKNSSLIHVKHDNCYLSNDEKHYKGKRNQLADLIEIYNINEVLFSCDEISYADLIEEMDKTKSKFVDFKTTLDKKWIIGSKQIDEMSV